MTVTAWLARCLWMTSIFYNGTAHTFYTINTDGTLSTPQTKNYVEQNATYCSSGINVYANGGYVEDRFADGDYRYADGTIPENNDQRMWTDTNDKTYFYPIWPDDYIYFGQMLTYGWNDQRLHQPGCQPRGIFETGQPVR